MKTKKPDIFLGVTMGLLVAAVLICILILNTQKSKNETEATNPPQTANTDNTQLSGNETMRRSTRRHLRPPRLPCSRRISPPSKTHN